MAQSVEFVGVVALVVVVASLLALFSVVRYQRKSAEVRGVQWVQALRMLLMHLQRHRGVVSMYHAGDNTVLSEITDLRDQIARDIGQISSIGDWIDQNQDWQGLTQHWARLSVNCLELDGDKSFDQHCRVIASLLALLEDVADQHYLDNAGFRDVKVLWHELLLIGELVGQSRALGVRVLGLRSGNGRLELHKKQIRSGLAEIERLLDLPVCRKKFSSQDMRNLTNFVEFVRIQLVDNIGPVSASEYFARATATVDLVYERFDMEIQQLCRQLGIER